MSKVGNNAEYTIGVKNISDKDYYVTSNNAQIKSDYLKYTMESEDKDGNILIPANSSKDIALKVEYVKEPPQSAYESGAYNDTRLLSFKLVDELPKPLINPKTATPTLIVLIVVIAFTVFYIKYGKNKKIKNLNILIAILLMGAVNFINIKPAGVSAKEDNSINVESSIVINESAVKTIDQNFEGYLSPGDEVAIGGEHFYIVSTNENETVLLTKYNLYVGDVFIDYKYQRSIDESEVGYGYQATEVTNVHVSSIGKDIGIVPFSGKTYWLDENNNVKDQYFPSTWSPMRGTKIFDSSFDQVKFEIDPATLNEDNSCVNGICRAKESDYSIAYYVNRYTDIIRNMGIDVKEGRLLTDDEAAELGCGLGYVYPNCPSRKSWLNQGIYWLGSLFEKPNPRIIERGQMYLEPYNNIDAGVRPVIVINTNIIPLLDHEYFANKPEIVY